MSETTRDIVFKDMAESAERMGLDLEDLQEMIDEVLEDFAVKIKTLIEAGENKDIPQIKEVGHDLKGAAANYGLLAASSIAEEVEKGCDLIPIEKIKVLEDEIKTLCSLNLAEK